MAITDWTFSGTGSGGLDPAVKYSGSSSYRSVAAVQTNYLTRNTFNSPRMQVVCQGRRNGADNQNRLYIRHSSYGDLKIVDAANEWQKWRATFWYDTGSNTKLGRLEKWDGGEWVQQGADTNFGTGSPASGTLALKHQCWVSTKYAYFDEVEVYS